MKGSAVASVVTLAGLVVLPELGAFSAPRSEVADATARPAGCESLAAGADLQASVDRTPDGGALCLAAGTYAAPVKLSRGITLWGPRDAVIRSNGEGTTVWLTGRGAKLAGLTVSGSGHRYDTLDAAVHLDKAEDAGVEGVHIEGAIFGILVDQSARVAIQRNDVVGPDIGTALGLRGDGIRLWETNDSVVEDNHLSRTRDLVVWYSSRNVLRRNVVEDGRYGTHLMYSHRNVLEANRYLRNEVGIFVMYSRDVQIRRNLLADSGGAAGIGLGIKESGNLSVVSNVAFHDTTGVYLDTSPMYVDDTNVFRGNHLLGCETGVTFHSSERRNTFGGNSFHDNQTQVRVEGGGDALGVTWDGNQFDDYAGYDLDGDGVGDVPYEQRSLTGQLTDTHPDLAFFRGSVALSMVEAAGRVVPLWAPRPILVDPHPATREPAARPDEGGARAN